MPFDNRLPLVDHILGQMILDRYGAYAFVRRVRSIPSTRDAVSNEVNLDLSPHPFPVPLSRRIFGGTSFSETRHRVVASLTSYLKRLADRALNAFGPISDESPTNLGRGSPWNLYPRNTRNDAKKKTTTSRHERHVYHVYSIVLILSLSIFAFFRVFRGQ